MLLLSLAMATALRVALTALTIDVTVDGRGTAGHDGTAGVRGTMTCSVETLVTFEGQVVESVGRSAVAAGSFATEVLCGTTPTPWAVTVTSDSGVPFKPGFALADIQAVGFDPETGTFVGVQSLASLHLTRSVR